MIKIANLLEEAKVGGPQRRVVFAARRMKGQAETTVVTSFENSADLENLCRNAQIPIKKINITRLTKEIKPLLKYLFFSVYEVLSAARYFKNSDFDVIHINGSSGFRGVLIAKLAGKKVVWHLTDTWAPTVILKIFSWLSYFSDGWIYSSERSKKYYQSLINSPKEEFIIPAPVDTEYVSKSMVSDEFSFEGGSCTGDIVVGTMAVINPVKGLEVLLEVAARIAKTHANIQFLILGPVHKNQISYFNSLKRMCERLDLNNVVFVGKRDDVRPFLKHIDIYMCTSLFESSPLSVWEAMAMELPIITTDVGDVGLYVKNNINGFVTKVGDVNAISKHLEYLAENKKCLVNFGTESRKIAVQKLDVGICADKHVRAYSAILNVPK